MAVSRPRLTMNFVVLGIIGIVALACAFVTRQGVSTREWKNFDLAQVQFDSRGIPTITNPDWTSLFRAQGYVVASDRLWQMDLFRRASAGRLAEWFGAKAVPHDTERRLEDWMGVADQAVLELPTDQRHTCEAYAEGVNRFIQDHHRRWGIEYAFLRETPESWRCRDSLLILMSLAADLTESSDRDLHYMQWKSHLSPEWFRFLFPSSHPWNKPMFGTKTDAGPSLPGPKEFLPQKPLQLQTASSSQPSEVALGSNNWAYRGKKGAFLANDPHLNSRAPQLWYAVRLKISESEWVVGASVPGLPGVVLGMNQSLAWAFTNTGEDVDDWLIEKVDLQSKTYEVRLSGGQTTKLSIQGRPYEIKVKDKEPVRGTAPFTHRGPLRKLNWGGATHYASRQWVGFHPEVLRLPSEAINRAKNWDDFNAAMDEMRIPSQNVLVLDRGGNMGYRTSGTGIERRVDGRLPMAADTGEWLGFKPPTSRLRKWVPRTNTNAVDHTFLGTANERIWLEGFSQGWYPDDRKKRMTEVLSTHNDLDRFDMEKLQQDTTSPYYQVVLHWVASHASDLDADTKGRWLAWNGNGESSPEAFTQAARAEELLVRTLMARIRDTNIEALKDLEYDVELKNAWVINLLGTPNGMNIFGLNDEQVATTLSARIRDERKTEPLYPEKNHWTAQHPFVKGIPILGRMFSINTPPMVGYKGVLRVERPDHAASMRLVWDGENPKNSTWIFPVGQSGHVWNRHYKDQQDDWFGNKTMLVFPEEQKGWGL